MERLTGNKIMKNTYKSGKPKPFYKIFISEKRIKSIKNKRADKILEELFHYNIRLYKNGKRMEIGSLELNIMFPSMEYNEEITPVAPNKSPGTLVEGGKK